MLLLHNPIQPYAWGPVDGIAHLVGSDPTGGHEAELWIGTHPRGPSLVVAGEHEGQTLAEVISADPARWLGPELTATGATALPFLLKVLAIGKPLSLQAHPSADQARAGYEREDAAGIALDSPARVYVDPNPKPEMLVGLEDTWVLTGFRTPEEAASLVSGLDSPVLAPLAAALARGGSDGLEAGLSWLLRLSGAPRRQVAKAAALAARHAFLAGGPERPADPYWWVTRLADDFPGDPTCLAPLLLVLRRLEPGADVAMPAGNLHAYLEGAGVEIMAASDNVLRGGLTPKHVDVDELLRVVVFEPADGAPAFAPAPAETGGAAPIQALLRPTSTAAPHGKVRTYDPGQPQFGLVRIGPGGGPIEIAPTQPSLLLALGGEVDLAGPGDGVSIGHGDAVFVAAGEGPITVSGMGTLWWATTAAGLPRSGG